MSPDLQIKVQASIRLIREWAQLPGPVLLTSFGKDSLALMELAKDAKVTVPLAYFELGLTPAKHSFARQRMLALGSGVELITPQRTTMIRSITDDRWVDLAYDFFLASGDVITIVGATMRELGQQTPECGLRFIRDNPAQRYQWRTILCGRKRADGDATVGPLSWSAPVHSLPRGSTIVMPLIEWTDDDVFSYLHSKSVFPDMRRYDHSLGARSNDIHNPDVSDICTRCLSTRRGSDVQCPMLGEVITAFAGVLEIDPRQQGSVVPAVMF